jgi:glycosyltransferase involved in cell wall biosynthesis
MRPFRLAIYARVASHHNALRLVVQQYVDACVKLHGADEVLILVPRDQAGRFARHPHVAVLPFDSDNALASHLTTLLGLPLLSLLHPRTHLVVPQIAFVGPVAGGTTAVVHDLIEWSVRSQTWAKLLARRTLYRSTFHFARRIVCVSNSTRDELVRLFPAYADKCAVVHNGVDALEAVPARPVEELTGGRFIAVVGYVSEPQKNLLCVIDAFAAAAGGGALDEPGSPPLRLAFAGPLGLRGREVIESARARLGDRFTYLGVIEDGQVRWLFEHCAAALAASRAEGFSLTPAQALFHGARVVASDIAPHREILGPGASYFDPASAADCGRALAECLGGAAPRATSASLPTWADLAGRLAPLLGPSAAP